MSHYVDSFFLVTYECDRCGYLSAQWLGFCPRCQDEGGLRESRRAPVDAEALSLADVEVEGGGFIPSGLGEWDRVLGGGLVPGSAVLVAGEPGVGKSTLLLQVAAAIASDDGRVLVASSEESVGQVGLRGRRLRAIVPAVHVLGVQDLARVLAAATGLRPSVLVVDSIQTLASAEVAGGAGGVAQVRHCAAELVAHGKRSNTTVVLIGHVTKDGAIAGPKILEHLVDVVLSLEGDHHRRLRLLRCRKNRFGATERVGLFELGDSGLKELPDGVLVDSWHGDVPGTVVFPAVEGSRALLVEIQALVSKAAGPQPRRSVRGLDAARVHQLLAVLESHAGLSFAGRDVYVAVAGGVRLSEPGADLPTALALASSLVGRPLGSVAAWGEVGLTGDVRSVGADERRHEEVSRLPIRTTITPGAPLERIEEVIAACGLVESSEASRVA